MKIAFLCNEYPPRPHGGIGTSVHQLAHGLSAAGHRVHVLGWGPEPGAWDDGPVRVEVVPATTVPKTGWWVNRHRLARRVAEIAASDGLDLVEGPDWTGIAAWQRLPVPYAVRLNGSETYFGEVLGHRVRPTVRWAEASNLHRADAVVSVSRFTWQVTRRLFGLSDDAVHLGIVPNGVDVDRFRPIADAATGEDAGDDPGGRPGVVLNFGTVTAKKGVYDLARAFPAVARAVPEAELWLAGRDNRDRETGASTVETIRQLVGDALASRVRHLGPVPYDEIPALLAEASVVCLPSHAEALPMTWIEALAAGRPLVASTRGPGPEVADDGTHALLVDPADHDALTAALVRLLRDRELAGRLGRAGRRRAEDVFHIERVMEANLAWYRRVIESERKP